MQSEESVEINHIFTRDVDRGAHCIVGALTMWNHNVESIRCAALEDHDQPLIVSPSVGCANGCACQETRNGRRAYDGECTIAQKNAAGDGHRTSLSSLKLGRTEQQAFNHGCVGCAGWIIQLALCNGRILQ